MDVQDATGGVYNKYEKYLKKKQTPEPSSRVESRLSQIEDKYNIATKQEELSLYELKSKVQSLERQLASQRNVVIVKEEKIKQLTQQLLEQPKKNREEAETLKRAMDKKEQAYRELQARFSRMETLKNQLQKTIETHKIRVKSLAL